MVRIAVRVTPKSGRDEVVGFVGTELQVRVTAAPDRGKANEAVRELLADALGVPKTAVRIARGETSRHMTLEIDGADEADVRRAFGEPEQPLF